MQVHEDGNQLNQVFSTSNVNMKYLFIGVVFTSNLSLKQPVVKILLYCLEISFMPFVFKIKPLFKSWWTNLKFKYLLLFSLFFFESVSSSPITFHLILTLLENNPCSRKNWWIVFDINRNQMRNIELLSEFYYKLCWKLNIWFLKYLSSMTSSNFFQFCFSLVFQELQALYLAHLHQESTFQSCRFHHCCLSLLLFFSEMPHHQLVS